MRAVSFRCLGALEIVIGGRSLSTGGPLQRGLLAMLLINANRVVSADRIIDALWDKPPDTALGQVQTRVWRLRQILQQSVGPEVGRPQLITRSGGYSLVIDPETLDLLSFDQRVQQAQALLQAERPADAVERLRDGLALWRGPAFADVQAPGVRAEAEAIEERRLTAIEQRLEVELALGLHQQVIPELRELVGVHPYRERLRYHLMRALYRSGRRAEAIEAYLEGYRSLVDGLGLEPSRELKDMHREILASEGQLEPVAAVAGAVRPGPVAVPEPAESSAGWTLRRPQDLPRDSICLVAREPELAELSDYLRRAGTPGNPKVAVLSGGAGVGKSVLALRLAHLLAEEFSDAQLFARLGPEPADPHAILGRFLRMFGIPARDIPNGLDERSALYRARTAELRMVLLLDDATAEGPVRALLPAGRGSVTLITSRSPLVALEGVSHREIDRLSSAGMIALLSSLVGAERISAWPEAGERIVRHCGGLPLPLRAVAARICARPHWPLTRFAEVLDDEHRRLDTVSFGDLDMRGTIARDYDRLPNSARRLFRLLGLVRQRRFSALMASRLLETAPEVAEELAEFLVERRLVRLVAAGASGPSEPPLPYEIDDLWWLFARERLAAEERPEERRRARGRLFGTDPE